MVEGRFGVVTPFPKSLLMTAMFMAGMLDVVKQRAKEGRVEESERELYTRLSIRGEKSVIDEVVNMTGDEVKEYLKGDWVKDDKGSSWIISCPEDHGIHHHTKQEDKPQLSKRRILFASDRGLTMEMFPVDDKGKAIDVMEVYDIEAGVICELEFDGAHAHHFIPKHGGKIVAYSVHPEDLTREQTTLDLQSDKFKLDIPDKRVVYKVDSDPVQKDVLIESLHGIDKVALRKEIRGIEVALKELDDIQGITGWEKRVTGEDKSKSMQIE